MQPGSADHQVRSRSSSQRITEPTHRGWHSRGYLPHFDSSAVLQTVTYRVADALPIEVAKRLHRALSDTEEIEHRKRIESYLDAGHGSCPLHDPTCAAIVRDGLLFHDRDRYLLHAWVIMPNHVHALIEPAAGWGLSSIVKTWKSYSAKRINRHLARTGALWQADYWDRFIGDEAHYRNVVSYILGNPAKAGLHEWIWTSTGS